MTPPRDTRKVQSPPPREAAAYPRFLAECAGIVAVLLLLGAWPTVKLGGSAAVPAMLAGCALSAAASLAGTLPLWMARHKTPQETLLASLGSIVLRLASVIALAAAAALSGWFATTALLLWVSISYAGLLVADVRFARAQLGA